MPSDASLGKLRNQLRMFEQIATKAGPILTHDTFREAAATMSQFRLPLSPYASLSAEKVDADDSFRLSVFVDDGSDNGTLEPMTDIMDGTP